MSAGSDEVPNIVYGRLLESAHLSGYGFERMTDELEWLLEGDRWESVGAGYSDVNEFLRSIDLSAFNLSEKKELHRRIKELQPDATVRAIGDATGTPKSNVHRDLNDVPAGTREPPQAPSEQDQSSGDVPTGTAEAPEPPHVTRNTGNDEWYTPGEYVTAARDVLDAIDLDPASSAAANRTVRAARFYGVDDDGLVQPWKGRVWMNPPYSTGLVDKFVTRLLEHVATADVTAAVVLTNNATDTRWWQSLARSSSAICLVAGRIRFRGPDGAFAGAGLQGQTIAYLGPDRSRFVERFGAFGVVL